MRGREGGGERGGREGGRDLRRGAKLSGDICEITLRVKGAIPLSTRSEVPSTHSGSRPPQVSDITWAAEGAHKADGGLCPGQNEVVVHIKRRTIIWTTICGCGTHVLVSMGHE